VGGLKLHDAPAGRPEQANETADEKPFSGDTDTLAVPLCPCSMLKEDGTIGSRAKFGTAMVYVADTTELLPKPVSAAIA
jgi:hypothetical protein